MSAYKEIVTKAVVGKGKKYYKNTYKVNTDSPVDTVLGCWVINHKFSGSDEAGKIVINGSYDVNLWYSYDNNTKTDIARGEVNYLKKINTKTIVQDINKDTREIIIETIQEPTCTNASINGTSICVDVCFELLASIIGETRVRVAILDQIDCTDYTDDDFEDEINENFISEE